MKRHQVIQEINLTPFIDVLLVLIIILMMIQNKIVSQIAVDLPHGKGQNKTLEAIELTVHPDGQYSINQKKIKDLGNYFKDFANKNPTVILYGDRKTPYSFVVHALSEIQKIGITQVSLAVDD
jgi:biopolymer transport protein ExbD